ncbi:MAG TPA: hypothetical protein VMR21_11680 [Vicinamibacteria bacterium]|nr:hypothetical protein [Vicinamibacteria bacterium]
MAGKGGEKGGEDAAKDEGPRPRPDQDPPVRITPVEPKVGEGTGNLERREEWLRRRRR